MKDTVRGNADFLPPQVYGNPPMKKRPESILLVITSARCDFSNIVFLISHLASKKGNVNKKMLIPFFADFLPLVTHGFYGGYGAWEVRMQSFFFSL
jgi:hypothetical protein